MRGNTNANTSGGGSSKEIKILNVVQTGILTRDGAKFNNFSTNDFLTFGARIDGGILSLDTSAISAKNLLPMTTNNWEIQVHFKTPDDFVKQEQYYGWMLLAIPTPNTFEVYINSSKTLGLSLDNNYSTGVTLLSVNTEYYVRFGYDGTKYYIKLSTTGSFTGEETTEIEYTAENINVNLTNLLRIGYHSDGRYTYSTTTGWIDIEETWIKINGEYWWKGVETL